MRSVAFLLMACLVPALSDAQTRPRRPAAPAKPLAPFTTPLTPAEMNGKQAVVETARGTFVVQLLPEVAPNHVGYFIAQAGQGAFDKTTFHSALRMGLIQGGDPLSKDPAKRAMYGTGGLGMLAQEFNREPVTRGAVAAVLQPGKPDSAGSQFFVAVSDQVALNGTVTVFGRVVEGPRGSAGDLRGASGREGEGDRADRDPLRRHPRRAATGTGAVFNRGCGGPGQVPRGDRDDGRRHHDYV
jgi:cyclophilin family peptidyl-prolyl cis-trans isomerase